MSVTAIPQIFRRDDLMTDKPSNNEFSLVYDEEKRIVIETQTGAILRSSPRPSGVSGFIVFGYTNKAFEIDFMVKTEEIEKTFITKTGEPYKRNVPARFIVGEDAIAQFENKFTRTHGRQPTDLEVDNFKRMVTEGIALLATHGNRHPEIFPNGEVLFARRIAPRT
jgi:hypothetical protein